MNTKSDRKCKLPCFDSKFVYLNIQFKFSQYTEDQIFCVFIIKTQY